MNNIFDQFAANIMQWGNPVVLRELRQREFADALRRRDAMLQAKRQEELQQRRMMADARESARRDIFAAHTPYGALFALELNKDVLTPEEYTAARAAVQQFNDAYELHLQRKRQQLLREKAGVAQANILARGGMVSETQPTVQREGEYPSPEFVGPMPPVVVPDPRYSNVDFGEGVQFYAHVPPRGRGMTPEEATRYGLRPISSGGKLWFAGSDGSIIPAVGPDGQQLEADPRIIKVPQPTGNVFDPYIDQPFFLQGRQVVPIPGVPPVVPHVAGTPQNAPAPSIIDWNDYNPD